MLLVVMLLAGCGGRRAEMRERLSVLNALNRADTVLTATHRDEAQVLADWFDRHGSANEQLLAHYLLGRCYADMHEAPMALHCYQEAISRADTLSPDCDFAQLSRVYGQSASIFYRQGLYRNQLEYLNKSEVYGFKGRDTLNALLSYAHKSYSYDLLLRSDSSFITLENAIKQLNGSGYNKVATGFSGLFAKKLIIKGESEQALLYLQDYEQHSGYFDSVGNIASGREVYYYTKGLYFLKIHLLDSAEYYFRKELRTGKDFNNQNAGALGLSQLFRLKHKLDSADKYAVYSYAMNDSMYAQRATHEVEQAKAMYDYSRQQEIAQQEKQKADRKQRIIWLILTGTVATFAITAYIFYRLRRMQQEKAAAYEKLLKDHVVMQSEVMQLRERKAKYDLLLQEKEQQVEALGTALSEIEDLKAEKSQFDQLIAWKEDELERQKEELSRYKHLKEHQDDVKAQMRETRIFKLVSEKAKRGEELTGSEWKQLERFVIDYLPEFYQFVTSREHALTTRMYHICILIRLQYPNKTIGYMMGVSAPSVSQARPIIFKKLFGNGDNSKDLGERLMEYC